MSASSRPKPGPLVRARLIVDALPYLRARGVDVDALARRFALPPIEDGARFVSVTVDVLRGFFDAAAEAAREPMLGVRLAEAAERGTFGVLEFVCRSAPTLREALRRVVRYDGLLNGAVRMTFEEGAEGGVLRHRFPGEPLCVGRAGNEYTVALLLREARAATRSDDVARSVAFAHDEPADAAFVAETLGVERISYRAGENRIELSSAMLERPLVTADDALSAYLEEQAERATAEQGTGPSLRATLERELRERIAAGPDLVETAARLGMTTRTLQRRLAEEGTSFQELVDDVRRAMAIGAVERTMRPLSEIAESLGYSDLRPFLRAFRRWTGRTPSELRGGAH